MAIVEAKVKPFRLGLKRQHLREQWWQFAEKRPGLYGAIQSLPRVLVNAQTSSYILFTFLPTQVVFSHALNIYLLSSYSSLATLQSRIHDVWGRFFASSLEERLRYTPTDCFETFPFPPNSEENSALEDTGREYYESRATVMVSNDQGLTATYNRFHDPEERDPGIMRLRELHASMDRAVLAAFGWTDIRTTCEFLLDYEDEGEGENATRRRKKPWRYRWPDEIRDQVLARLLELNRVRAEEEQLSGAAAEANSRSRANRQPRKTKKNQAVGTASLLDTLSEEGQS